MTIRKLTTITEREIEQLADVTIDCVEGGASIGFMLPLTKDRACDFWRRVAADAAQGTRIVFVDEDAEGIAGTVQLVLDVPENQPHRGDIAKMQVHRRARRQGLGEALLRAAEQEAKRLGKSLLVLDTVPGEAAERLYQRMGWQLTGIIPDYALWPGGGLCDTAVYYRKLA